ncbi:unnamed protein product [Anisakis simplex]|uniref:Beta-sarcoglycan n=1 Tax=Anisakis simplex TaxID=6269 RepID=A0A158PNR1_ANISI|nr:unnamed protein product [Anisakis simplex]
MPAGGPTYLRSEKPEVVDFKDTPSIQEYNLHVTGLREKRLWILLGVMILLTLLTIAVLIMNMFIIKVLDMSTRGMKLMQFHTRYDTRTDREESVVQFTANNVHLGKVVAKSGLVHGAVGKDLNVHGSRVIIRGLKDGTRFLLQEGICRFENVDQFIVKDSSRPLFSVQHPMFTIDSRVKKISTEQIVTNKVHLEEEHFKEISEVLRKEEMTVQHTCKVGEEREEVRATDLSVQFALDEPTVSLTSVLQIRSPINENLNVDVINLSVRGNEGVKMEAKRFNATAKTSIILRTSKDGKMLFSARKMYIGSNWLSLPISSSPSLTASIDAMRVCICIAARPKLFTVAGNKPCIAAPNFCV